MTNVVNNVTIAPWGAPLQLTDADVEAALATVPGLAGTPALPEVVGALMELVKRAHVSAAARNIHLNPKRTDQALALTPGGWAALPLEEATAALFDGASASMAAARAPSVRQTIRTTIPVQYRAERADAVQLGLRPMGAHLLNVAPGGPGPLLLTAAPTSAVAPAPVAPTAASTAASTAAVAPSTAAHLERVQAALKAHPIRLSPTGALRIEWIVEATQAAGLSGRDLFVALEAGGAELAEAWAAAQVFMREKMRPCREE